ncbi:pentapeptide repeat-containing protein [Streptomyces sp. enrichment culture]|uniref:pentapeptide repeat-containing protein n=1 Tax=Streptomyces sp. enrichment culture TaxID=1795815 RepID=UPI003F550093
MTVQQTSLGADLTNGHLLGAYLAGADLTSADLRGARLDGVNCYWLQPTLTVTPAYLRWRVICPHDAGIRYSGADVVVHLFPHTGQRLQAAHSALTPTRAPVRAVYGRYPFPPVCARPSSGVRAPQGC